MHHAACRDRSLTAAVETFLRVGPALALSATSRADEAACQRRSNKNAAQRASSGNASWNSVSDRARAIECPAMATTWWLIRGRIPYLDHPGTTG
jgi:hypothetical protein